MGKQAFRAAFGRDPELVARAPGRVNLIGEHTDYNEGLALPCAIDRATRVAAARRDDRSVRVRSLALGAEIHFALGDAARLRDWADYVRAPALALAEAGHAPGGADLLIASDVPLGAGLSSSAALSVAVTRALAGLAGVALTPLAAARLAHRAESHFVGIGCGILDPFASALAEPDTAHRIDCRTQEVTPVPLPSDAVWLVADTGARRELARGGYGERVAECGTALAAAKRVELAPANATALRDIPPSAVPRLAGALPDTLARRIRHVVSENARVDACVAALGARDLAAAGALLRESHASLRDDYAVSAPELDALCALGDAAPGCFGSRLTGAGFGGCTLHLVAPDAADRVATSLADGFRARFGRTPPIFQLRTVAPE
jgi:galactokinase